MVGSTTASVSHVQLPSTASMSQLLIHNFYVTASTSQFRLGTSPCILNRSTTASVSHVQLPPTSSVSQLLYHTSSFYITVMSQLLYHSFHVTASMPQLLCHSFYIIASMTQYPYHSLHDAPSAVFEL